MTKKIKKLADVTGKTPTGLGTWFYSAMVQEHFFNPRNFLVGYPKEFKHNAQGQVGSAACGDVMRMWLAVDKKTERIKDLRWRTFGCGSAIAATSMMSEIVLRGPGLTLDEARHLKPQDIIKELGGLPPRKIHCSVLCDKALRDAINDYYRRAGKFDKIVPESARVIDAVTKVTDHDIEQAVLDGCRTLEEVQARTKVGLGDRRCLAEVENLIRFYSEKHFGI